MLWLLASESDHGEIDASIDELLFRLRMDKKSFTDALNPLIEKGFFGSDGEPLAECKQDSPLETEIETERETEEENIYTSKKGRKLKGPVLERFETFMDAFDYRKGKAEAADAWLDVGEKGDFDLIIEKAKEEADIRERIVAKGMTPIYPQGWLTARRWEDERTLLPKSEMEEAIDRL